MKKEKQQDASGQESDIQAAAALVLERERRRGRMLAVRERRRQRRQRKEQLAAVQRMRQSIEVIKWCIVGIASVMFVGLVIGIVTLMRVQTEVAEIERNVDHVREAMRHPMQSLGASFGEELDEKLQSLIGTNKEPQDN